MVSSSACWTCCGWVMSTWRRVRRDEQVLCSSLAPSPDRSNTVANTSKPRVSRRFTVAFPKPESQPAGKQGRTLYWWYRSCSTDRPQYKLQSIKCQQNPSIDLAPACEEHTCSSRYNMKRSDSALCLWRVQHCFTGRNVGIFGKSDVCTDLWLHYKLNRTILCLQQVHTYKHLTQPLCTTEN